MARPANADADRTRARILSSALGLFGERGKGGASVRDIARGADVSLAMVSHYFGGKDALYARCIDEMYAKLAALRSELGRELTALSAERERELARITRLDSLIEKAVRTSFRFAREHQTEIRMLMRSVVEVGELDPARRRDVQGPFLDEISRAVSIAIDRPMADVRVALQTIVFATARWAISSEREMELVTGRRGQAAVRVIEDHLADTAKAALERKGKS